MRRFWNARARFGSRARNCIHRRNEGRTRNSTHEPLCQSASSMILLHEGAQSYTQECAFFVPLRIPAWIFYWRSSKQRVKLTHQ